MKPESKPFFGVSFIFALAFSSSAFGTEIWKDRFTVKLNHRKDGAGTLTLSSICNYTGGTTTAKSWSNFYSAASGDALEAIFTSLGGSVPGSGVVTGNGKFAFTGNTLNCTAVPEPSSALVGLLVAAGWLSRRRHAVSRK